MWKGDLTTTFSTPQTTPPSSPLNLTFSQLTSLTSTSPLSPNTLNSSRLNIIDDSSILNKAPPSIGSSLNQEIHRQEGTILRARVNPCCQRIPLVAMAINENRVGGYSRDEVNDSQSVEKYITCAWCKVVDFVCFILLYIS